MAPDLNIVVVINQVDAQSGEYPVQLWHEGKPLEEVRVHIGFQRLLEHEHAYSPAAYGMELFDALFAGAVGRAYQRLMGQASAQGTIRVQLVISPNAPELHALPWERLFHVVGDQDVPLAATAQTPFSRFLMTGAADQPPVVEQTLRMLVATANPDGLPAGMLPLDVAGEVAALASLLAGQRDRIQLTVLPGRTGLPSQLREQLSAFGAQVRDEAASWQAIQRHLPGHHILHVLAHGQFRAGERTAYLLLEHPGDEEHVAGTVERVADTAIAAGLAGVHPLPQLVFLAACDSAKRLADGANPFVGLGPRLVHAGVPAVVAMQDLVPVQVAHTLTGDFYRRLFDHGQVDLALNEARSLLLRADRFEWAIPVLFLRLTDGLLFRPERRLAPRDRRPYKGLIPYSRDDAALFAGRDREIADISDLVAEFPLTVMRGEPGNGLTSLVAAGLGPRLESEGDLVVILAKYDDLVREVRARLRVTGQVSPSYVAGGSSLVQALQAAVGHAQSCRRLVLILDQAERIFDLRPAARQSLIGDLGGCLEHLGDTLRLVFTVHEDAQPALLDLLRPLRRWRLSTTALPALSSTEAEEAIIKPLEILNWPVSLVPQSLAGKQIIPDLAELSGKQGDIDPGSLQVVCEHLYREALSPDRGRAITEALYVQAKWAEGILTTHVEEKLDKLGTDRPVAEQILAAVAAARGEQWLPEERLIGDGQPSARKRALDLAVQDNLLREHRLGGQHGYAFASPVVARIAERLRATEQQLGAEKEMARVWSAWVDRHAIATPGQLRHLQYLVSAGAHPTASPPQALLLLRSAVARIEPVDSWLGWTRSPLTKALITQLEHPTAEIKQEERAGRTAMQQGGELLGAELPRAEERGEPYGTVARAAVSGGDPGARQAAALALTSLGTHEAIDRLRWALDKEPVPGNAWLRKIELRGVLIEALPGAHELGADLSAADRIGVWWWRVWRRIVHDRWRMVGLTFGGAVGAGVALAPLRYVTAVLLRKGFTPGLQLAMFYFWGSLLGAALAFGLLLGGTLTPGGSVTSDNAPALNSRSHKVALLSIGLGTLLFGAMLAVIAALIGLTGENIMPVVAMGFVAGLGLSLSVYGQPARGWRLGTGEWLGRFGVAMLGFVLSQMFFVVSEFPQLLAAARNALGRAEFLFPGTQDANVTIVWSGKTYCANFSGGLATYFQALCKEPAVKVALSLIDAALVGALLMAGISTGLLIADRLLRRWRKLSARAGD